MIDNFNIVRDNLLRFDREGEFYMLLVLRRRKDVKGKVVEGVNEDNRLIKHYFVYDAEYFEKKRNAIIALCDQNNARAYILPQRRSCGLVLWSLHDTVSDTLRRGSMNIHFDHLIRSSVAGIHEVPPDCRHYKRWVIDIDADDFFTKRIVERWKGSEIAQGDVHTACKEYAEWLSMMLRIALSLPPEDRPNDAKAFMPNLKTRFNASDITLLPTPHGFHIVTPPFNRTPIEKEKYFGAGCPRADWIKPDAMALLYAPDAIG